MMDEEHCMMNHMRKTTMTYAITIVPYITRRRNVIDHTTQHIMS